MLQLLPAFLVQLHPGLLKHYLVHLLVIFNILLFDFLLLSDLLVKCQLDHLPLLHHVLLLLPLLLPIKLIIVIMDLGPLVVVYVRRHALQVLAAFGVYRLGVFIWNLLLTKLESNVGIFLVL